MPKANGNGTVPTTPQGEIDWESVYIEQGIAGVIGLQNQMISASYQKDQNIREMWARFSRKNPDLEDHMGVAVQALDDEFIKRHANRPTNEALEILADETRRRVRHAEAEGIQGPYNGQIDPRERAVAQGGPVHGRGFEEGHRPVPLPDRGGTLGDIVKQRRASRARGA